MSFREILKDRFNTIEKSILNITSNLKNQLNVFITFEQFLKEYKLMYDAITQKCAHCELKQCETCPLWIIIDDIKTEEDTTE